MVEQSLVVGHDLVRIVGARIWQATLESVLLELHSENAGSASVRRSQFNPEYGYVRLIAQPIILIPLLNLSANLTFKGVILSLGIG